MLLHIVGRSQITSNLKGCYSIHHFGWVSSWHKACGNSFFEKCQRRKACFRFCHVCCMCEQEGSLISEISLFSLRWDLWALRTVVCYTGWKAQSFLKKRSMPLCDQMAGIFYCISSIKLSTCSLGLNSICWLPCFMQFGQESHLHHIWLL